MIFAVPLELATVKNVSKSIPTLFSILSTARVLVVSSIPVYALLLFSGPIIFVASFLAFSIVGHRDELCCNY